MSAKITDIKRAVLVQLILSASLISAFIMAKPDYNFISNKLFLLYHTKEHNFLKHAFKDNFHCSLPSLAFNSPYSNIKEFREMGSLGYWSLPYNSKEDDLNTIIEGIYKEQDFNILSRESFQKIFFLEFNKIYDSLSLEMYDSIEVIHNYLFIENKKRIVGLWNQDSTLKNFYNFYDSYDRANDTIKLAYSLKAYLQKDITSYKGENLIGKLDFRKLDCDFTYEKFLDEHSNLDAAELHASMLPIWRDIMDLRLISVMKYLSQKQSDNITIFGISNYRYVLLLVGPLGLLGLIIYITALVYNIKNDSIEIKKISFVPIYKDVFSRLWTLMAYVIIPIGACLVTLMGFYNSTVQMSSRDLRMFIISSIISLLILALCIYILFIFKSIRKHWN